jgi:hypothetical protein
LILYELVLDFPIGKVTGFRRGFLDLAFPGASRVKSRFLVSYATGQSQLLPDHIFVVATVDQRVNFTGVVATKQATAFNAWTKEEIFMCGPFRHFYTEGSWLSLF